MISLSLIETEAQRLVGHLPVARRLAEQDALVELCEKHWQSLRGPQPDTPLARTLWSITPPLADLLIDLYASGNAKLDAILHGDHLARGMALVVMSEVEHGNEAGVHLAHEPMMAFESSSIPNHLGERYASLLLGTLEPPPLHLHDKHHGGMWKALAVIASHTRRLDLPAVLAVIHLLIDIPTQAIASVDARLAELQHALDEVGIRFMNVEDDHVHFEQHGHPHKPIRTRRLGEMLLEIRQTWLG